MRTPGNIHPAGRVAMSIREPSTSAHSLSLDFLRGADVEETF